MERLSLFYNNHWYDDIYVDEIDEKIKKLGLPEEKLDVVSYPEGSKITPFNISEDEYLILTQLELISPPSNLNFKAIFEELKKDPSYTDLFEAISKNNKILIENNLSPISLNLSEIEEVKKTYVIKDETSPISPMFYMKKGKRIKDFKTGKKI